MSKKILIDAAYPGEARVAIHDGKLIQDYDYENSHKKQLKGNIYLARITRVEPSLQAAFIEYGGDKHGFLPFSEIHHKYFLENPDQFKPEEKGKSLADKFSSINIGEISEDVLQEEVVAEDAESSDAEAIAEDVKDSSYEDDLYDENQTAENTFHQKHKIQDVIRKGQLVLVQVLKEERGNKGAACTTYISLAGRYCVLMPNSERQGGISRRIVNPQDRKHLRKVLSTIDLPDGVSIILRTAGAGRKVNEIRRDYNYLARLWNAIRDYAIEANVNTFIHAESDLLKRTIRDLYSSEISEILIQGSEGYKAVKDFIKKILPLHAAKVKEYKGKTPIFTKYELDEQIAALYNPVVHLPSGGYLVINPTEALIAVDVNSGKATNEQNIEETAYKTNLEAAFELARQLKLRDLSGLIVIDFIDMMDANNRKNVEKTLRDAFQSDRAKVQMSTISPFGLLELSRQRLQSSFMESNTTKCHACNGKGHIKSFDSNAMIMLRTIEAEIFKADSEVINIYAHQDMAMHLLNEKRKELAALEEKYKCKIIIHKENTVYYDGFAIEKVAKSDKKDGKTKTPKLDEEEIDSLGEEVLDDDMLKQENNLGLGDDLAPYNVNDDIVISQNADPYIHNNRGGSRFKKSNSRGGKRRINKPRSGNEEEFIPSSSKPTLIFQPQDENNNKMRKPRNRHRRKDFKKAPEKKSALKSWWERLLE
jgi:ribonuclease E